MRKSHGSPGTIPIAIGSLAVSLLACGSDEIASQRDKWLERRPEQFVIQTCGTGFVAPGCSPRAVDRASEPDPVEEVFDTVEDTECDIRTLSFDRSYGFISEYYLDCGEEGWGATVQCFVPDTLDTARCAR